jgi:hypothetical protein
LGALFGKSYQESRKVKSGSFHKDFRREKATQKAETANLVAFARISEGKKLPRKLPWMVWVVFYENLSVILLAVQKHFYKKSIKLKKGLAIFEDACIMLDD